MWARYDGNTVCLVDASYLKSNTVRKEAYVLLYSRDFDFTHDGANVPQKIKVTAVKQGVGLCAHIIGLYARGFHK